ncbi:hypothetical protein [Candidatus Binatus soli]|jgi:hypothetical protein|uniref:hypothetical protein n=1 Tax=Candidatus Binatus soli TaxID=1953413 RepID=UPI003D0E49DD
MKQAIALLFLSFGFVCIMLGSPRNGGVANASDVCPSPAPSCTSSGTLSDLKGTYACSKVETDQDNTVKVGIMLFTSTGTGSVTSLSAHKDQDAR